MKFTAREAPTFVNLPADQSVDTDPGLPIAIVTWTAPSVSSPATVTSSHNPGDAFPIGTATVTYTAVDGFGSVITDGFTITVTGMYGVK